MVYSVCNGARPAPPATVPSPVYDTSAAAAAVEHGGGGGEDSVGDDDGGVDGVLISGASSDDGCVHDSDGSNDSDGSVGDSAVPTLPEAAFVGNRVPAANVITGMQYQLQCIVRHTGRHAFAGHYTTDVRGDLTLESTSSENAPPRPAKRQRTDAASGGVSKATQWYRHNDSTVTALGDDTADVAAQSSRSCYMLMYTLQPASK